MPRSIQSTGWEGDWERRWGLSRKEVERDPVGVRNTHSQPRDPGVCSLIDIIMVVLRWSAAFPMVKNPPSVKETWVQSLSREDPLEKEMATHSSILVWRIPWTEEPGRLQSMGLKELDTTYQLKRERDGIWNCETNFFAIMNTSAIIFHSPAKAEVLIYSNKLEYTQRHTYTQIHTCPSRWQETTRNNLLVKSGGM